jgi:uncharacterized protein (DUF2126 family)/transglutaminase-like putative cysteine protease
MVLHVALQHRTTYAYDRPVELGPQIIRLRPAPHCRTRIVSYSLEVEPRQHFLNWQQDPHSNHLARVLIPEKTTRFAVEVGLVAEIAVINPLDFFLEPAAESVPFAYEPLLKKDLEPYLEVLPPGPGLSDLLASIPTSPEATVSFLVELNGRLQREIDYVIRMEPGIQSFEETLRLGRGSCRDTAWLLVQILRQRGLAARFVSGYLIQLKPDVAALDGPTGAASDFTDLHAWAEVYLPGAGWVGLDPTSGLFAGEGHIPLACTPDPENAAPITGSAGPAEVDFSFDMRIARILETPRVTKPYSDEQWAAIVAVGDEVDRRLAEGDVRLTMGGEPTFVGIDEPDAAEWNTAAEGEHKRACAAALIHRLRDRFAPTSLLHCGQGKWYPGEELPRWAFALYWRRDGVPLWRETALIAEDAQAPHATVDDARRLACSLAERLGLAPDYVIPAYEDPRGREIDLRDAGSELFVPGLGMPTGLVLPIQPWQSRAPGRGWRSERWPLRDGRMILIPGISPMGFRLPLDKLRELAPEDWPHVYPLDPFAARAPLPERATLFQPRTAQPAPPSGQDLPVRTALTVEVREGHLNAFLPPTESGDDFCALVEAIEDTAQALALSVRVEGYPPPADARIDSIKVTPDPGVIEVNIHPAHSWREQIEITEALYEEARLARLSVEKFMLDGRHVGTGGGNHIVVGGPSAPDSPFLRRPDLLASMITYWQNHPALSFLFSGLFIGPTSQAPRIDEARDDSLYELEIALARVPGPDAQCPSWLVDRLFRNLLVDVTGNTHRAEICIDKLYAPEGPTGRLGLVEFRAFEMPPHARMSLAQQLLLRALIAWFWQQPYRARLVRWGSALHDRFMLPHVVWADFLDVLDDLRAAGFAFADAWFLPHFEFRFPVCGTVAYGGVTIELRQALEPWHVLGEEGILGGTVRYVDSSLERLQVLARGINHDRHAVTCNRRTLPLAPTGRHGEAVAGVRFRAWQPPLCLHPTIGVHTPLVFDLVDRWSCRSLGGCTYHVAHPGGRNYETLPLNAYEAEGRRLARFQDFGHAAAPMHIDAAIVNPDFPYTLDLRRFD